jgi:hypothetical protein
MKRQGKKYHTQWAGQFGTAHELTRRGYLVTFTAGNAPAVDLLCQSPEGESFSVEVKSLTSKTYFLCQDGLTKPNASRFFVFVLLPASLLERPEYFVLNNKQFLDVVEEQKQISQASEIKRGQPYAAFSFGINYRTLARDEFRDGWDNLPK